MVLMAEYSFSEIKPTLPKIRYHMRMDPYTKTLFLKNIYFFRRRHFLPVLYLLSHLMVAHLLPDLDKEANEVVELKLAFSNLVNLGHIQIDESL